MNKNSKRREKKRDEKAAAKDKNSKFSADVETDKIVDKKEKSKIKRQGND